MKPANRSRWLALAVALAAALTARRGPLVSTFGESHSSFTSMRQFSWASCCYIPCSGWPLSASITSPDGVAESVPD